MGKVSKRAKPLLGESTVRSPDGRDLWINADRRAFLREAARLDRRILGALAKLLPRWKRDRARILVEEWTRKLRTIAPWVTVPWVIDFAISTLDVWAVAPPLPKNRAERIVPPSTAYWSDGLPPLQMDLESWDPRSERWEEFRKRAQSALEKELSAYEAAARGRLKDAGFTLLPRKRGATTERKADHFRWLAQHVVLGLTYKEIVEREYSATDGIKEPMDAGTVRRAIRALAQRLNLPPVDGI